MKTFSFVRLYPIDNEVLLSNVILKKTSYLINSFFRKHIIIVRLQVHIFADNRIVIKLTGHNVCMFIQRFQDNDFILFGDLFLQLCVPILINIPRVLCISYLDNKGERSTKSTGLYNVTIYCSFNVLLIEKKPSKTRCCSFKYVKYTVKHNLLLFMFLYW